MKEEVVPCVQKKALDSEGGGEWEGDGDGMDPGVRVTLCMRVNVVSVW